MLQNSASEGGRTFSCHLSTCLIKKKNEKRQPRCKGGGRLFWSHLCSHYPTFSLKLPLAIRISNILVFMSLSYIDSYVHTRCLCEDKVAPPAYWVHRTPSSKLYLCASILSLTAIDGTRMPVATITRTLSTYAQAHSNKNRVDSRRGKTENNSRLGIPHTRFPLHICTQYQNVVAHTNPMHSRQTKAKPLCWIVPHPTAVQQTPNVSVHLVGVPWHVLCSVKFRLWRREADQCSSKCG